MNGTIAQAIALACHANAALARLPTRPFLPSNSTCQFCDRVTFATTHRSIFGRKTTRLCAETPEGWFAWLAANRARSVALAWIPSGDPRVPDRQLAGLVGGGGTWFIQTRHDRNSTMHWVASWEVWNSEAADQRIWRVSYACVSRAATERPARANLQAVCEELKEVLVEIRAFAQAHGCGEFAECFSRALDSLTTQGLRGYHRDLSPDGVLDPTATAILDACQSAWVFGGMGSWNDLGFQGQDQEDYDRLSERLFHVVIGAITSAVNDFSSKRRESIPA